MAENPFAKFAQPAENPFAKFAAPAEVPVEAPVDNEIYDRLNAAIQGGDNQAELAIRQELDAKGMPQAKAGSVEGLAGVIGTIGSSIIAEPIAGVAGLVQSVNPFAEEGAGARAVEGVRKALTLKPKSESTQKMLQGLNESLVGDAGRGFEAAENWLGDTTMDITGSPALAAAAKSVPTAFTELLGLGAGKRAVKGITRNGKPKRVEIPEKVSQKEIDKALVESAPDVEPLKDASREVYKEIDEAGVKLKPKVSEALASKLKQVGKKERIGKGITPKTDASFKAIIDDLETGQPIALTELEDLRKIASKAASSMEAADARTGMLLIDEIDDFMDKIGDAGIVTKKGSNVADSYKSARSLWGRAKRAELISEAMERAPRHGSGFENGIRTQLRQIINNKKRAKYFSKDELKAMSDVVEGTSEQNILKLVGRLGFSEGQATNILGGGLGMAAGAGVGGAHGAAVVGSIGQIARGRAQKATVKNARLADALVRAGSDGKEVVKAYLQSTPKSKRSMRELSDILTDPNYDIDRLLKSSSKMAREAAEVAKGRRAFAIGESAGVLAPGASIPSEEKQ